MKNDDLKWKGGEIPLGLSNIGTSLVTKPSLPYNTYISDWKGDFDPLGPGSTTEIYDDDPTYSAAISQIRRYMAQAKKHGTSQKSANTTTNYDSEKVEAKNGTYEVLTSRKSKMLPPSTDFPMEFYRNQVIIKFGCYTRYLNDRSKVYKKIINDVENYVDSTASGLWGHEDVTDGSTKDTSTDPSTGLQTSYFEIRFMFEKSEDLDMFIKNWIVLKKLTSD